MVPDYMEAINDDADCDDDFSFSAWTYEPFPEVFFLGSSDLNGHLVLSPCPSLAPG